MAVVIPLRITVANTIQYINNTIGKKVQGKISFYAKNYTKKDGMWVRGYYISCIGLNEKEILAYVES